MSYNAMMPGMGKKPSEMKPHARPASWRGQLRNAAMMAVPLLTTLLSSSGCAKGGLQSFGQPQAQTANLTAMSDTLSPTQRAELDGLFEKPAARLYAMLLYMNWQVNESAEHARALGPAYHLLGFETYQIYDGLPGFAKGLVPQPPKKLTIEESLEEWNYRYISLRDRPLHESQKRRVRELLEESEKQITNPMIAPFLGIDEETIMGLKDAFAKASDGQRLEIMGTALHHCSTEELVKAIREEVRNSEFPTMENGPEREKEQRKIIMSGYVLRLFDPTMPKDLKMALHNGHLRDVCEKTGDNLTQFHLAKNLVLHAHGQPLQMKDLPRYQYHEISPGVYAMIPERDDTINVYSVSAAARGRGAR